MSEAAGNPGCRFRVVLALDGGLPKTMEHVPMANEQQNPQRNPQQQQSNPQQGGQQKPGQQQQGGQQKPGQGGQHQGGQQKPGQGGQGGQHGGGMDR
jgi:hypothetical protein